MNCGGAGCRAEQMGTWHRPTLRWKDSKNAAAEPVKGGFKVCTKPARFWLRAQVNETGVKAEDSTTKKKGNQLEVGNGHPEAVVSSTNHSFLPDKHK